VGFHRDRHVRVEHVADEPVHLRKRHVLCRRRGHQLTVYFLKRSCCSTFTGRVGFAEEGFGGRKVFVYVPGDNGSSICCWSCTAPIASASLALPLPPSPPAQSMLVSLKLGASMNRLPPEPARTSSVIFSTKVLAAGIEIRGQAKLPVANNGGALCLCASAFTRAAATALGTEAPAAHSKSKPCIPGKRIEMFRNNVARNTAQISEKNAESGHTKRKVLANAAAGVARRRFRGGRCGIRWRGRAAVSRRRLGARGRAADGGPCGAWGRCVRGMRVRVGAGAVYTAP
jgi:hypothetical protein